MTTPVEAVIIVPYDPSWKSAYANESALLQQVFSETDATIEHVGSTAVEGLGSKPTIDIMVGLDSLAHLPQRMEGLEDLGYGYMPEYELETPERRFFRKPLIGERRYHLHCVCKDTDFFRDHIMFRDYLRLNAAAAREYLELKQSLVSRFGRDRKSYTDGKTDFIHQILARAKQESLVL